MTEYEATSSTNNFLAKKKKTDLFHCNGGDGENELDSYFLSKHRWWPKPRGGGTGGVHSTKS